MRLALALMLGNDEEMLTIREAARLLRRSKAPDQNLLAGKVKDSPPVPFIPPGRRNLVRRESLLWGMEKAQAQCLVSRLRSFFTAPSWSRLCYGAAPWAQKRNP
jgi:hypothetical protein